MHAFILFCESFITRTDDFTRYSVRSVCCTQASPLFWSFCIAWHVFWSKESIRKCAIVDFGSCMALLEGCIRTWDMWTTPTGTKFQADVKSWDRALDFFFIIIKSFSWFHWCAFGVLILTKWIWSQMCLTVNPSLNANQTWLMSAEVEWSNSWWLGLWEIQWRSHSPGFRGT